MGRHLEFDYDQAIARATELFWSKGYSNTGVRDLLKVMEIGEGSFYHVLKSKKALYGECLKHYHEIVTRRRLDVLSSTVSAKQAIRAFFQTVLDDLDDVRTPRVCLVASSLSDDVLAESGMQALIIDSFRQFETEIISCLNTGKSNGELPATFDSEIVAQTLVTYLQGLFRVIRVLKDRKQMEKQIEALLVGLGL